MQVVEAHGARIPQIGLGTMTLKDDVCVRAVDAALQIGYRHLDTAAFYGNEKENGEGLRQSGVKREDVFICTKVRQGDLMPDAFAKVLDQSLANLKLPYVDLLLIHWNNTDIPLKLSVGALCKAKKEGKTKHIGVANFTTALLDEAWAVTSEPLVCNQIEMHPFINQDKVLAACKKHGMAVVAYCPIARGKVPGADALERIGKAHGKERGASFAALSGADGCLLHPAHRDARAPEAESRRLRFQTFGCRDGGAQEAQCDQHARGQSAARAGVGYAIVSTTTRKLAPTSRPKASASRLSALAPGRLRGRDCARLTEQAIRIGYRHIDTAQMYDNEREVGEGVRPPACASEVMVTTKVQPTLLAPHDLERSVKESLAKLRLDVIDLLLIHWPNPRVPLAETLGAMAKMKREGYTRHIGVSNFTVALLEEANRISTRAAGLQPDRMPSVSQSGQGDRGLPQARHGGCRL